MSEPFLGEIKMVGFSFAPKGWAACDGQLLSIAQNSALYALLGTIFGGDARVTFALPDMRGRAPVHPGAGFVQGERKGEESVTITADSMAQHTHVFSGDTADGTSPAPTDKVYAAAKWAGETAANIYGPPSGLIQLNPATCTSAGGNAPHQNLQPRLAVFFAIALRGIFPSRN